MPCISNCLPNRSYFIRVCSSQCSFTLAAASTYRRCACLSKRDNPGYALFFCCLDCCLVHRTVTCCHAAVTKRGCDFYSTSALWAEPLASFALRFQGGREFDATASAHMHVRLPCASRLAIWTSVFPLLSVSGIQRQNSTASSTLKPTPNTLSDRGLTCFTAPSRRQSQYLWLKVTCSLHLFAQGALELHHFSQALEADLLGDRVGLLQLPTRECIHDFAVLATCAWVYGLGCLEVSLPLLPNNRFAADNTGGRSNCPCQLPLCSREVADVSLHVALGTLCCWCAALAKCLPVDVFTTELAQ